MLKGFGGGGFLGQQERPQAERVMSQWERDALDRRRDQEARDIAEHPALYRKMCELEAKMERMERTLAHLCPDKSDDV